MFAKVPHRSPKVALRNRIVLKRVWEGAPFPNPRTSAFQHAAGFRRAAGQHFSKKRKADQLTSESRRLERADMLMCSYSSAIADSAAVLPKTRAEARPLVYPPTETPPTSTPAAYSPGRGLSVRRSTRQPASTASPPIVWVMAGATSTATIGGTSMGAAGGPPGGESLPPCL